MVEPWTFAGRPIWPNFPYSEILKVTEIDGGNWVWKNLWVAFEEMHEEMVKRLVIDWHDDIATYMRTYTRPF